MTDEEYAEYWEPVSKGQFENTKKLLSLLNVQYTDLRDDKGELVSDEEFWSSIILTPKIKNNLKALAGPYKEAIKKILAIKKGLPNLS